MRRSDLVDGAALNRLGGAPNGKHVHHGILKSFQKSGYDRTRPAIGICIQYITEHGIRLLLDHNRKFTQGNKLLPPIPEGASAPLYGALACTHFNISLRCIKNGIPSPIGNLSDLLDLQNLKEVVLRKPLGPPKDGVEQLRPVGPQPAQLSEFGG